MIYLSCFFFLFSPKFPLSVCNTSFFVLKCMLSIAYSLSLIRNIPKHPSEVTVNRLTHGLRHLPIAINSLNFDFFKVVLLLFSFHISVNWHVIQNAFVIGLRALRLTLIYSHAHRILYTITSRGPSFFLKYSNSQTSRPNYGSMKKVA